MSIGSSFHKATARGRKLFIVDVLYNKFLRNKPEMQARATPTDVLLC